MADNSMALNNTLMQLGGEDFLRELTEFTYRKLKAFIPLNKAVKY